MPLTNLYDRDIFRYSLGKLQIRDSRDRVMKSKRGFSTQEEAVAVGDNEKDRLVASGSLPGDGVPTPSRSTRRSRR
jgi:hypothetical protein